MLSNAGQGTSQARSSCKEDPLARAAPSPAGARGDVTNKQPRCHRPVLTPALTHCAGQNAAETN